MFSTNHPITAARMCWIRFFVVMIPAAQVLGLHFDTSLVLRATSETGPSDSDTMKTHGLHMIQRRTSVYNSTHAQRGRDGDEEQVSACSGLAAAVMSASCAGNYPAFVEGLVKRLSERVHGNSLNYALTNFATPDMAGHGKVWLEFGVYTGYTARLIVEKLKEFERTSGVEGSMYYGFDSFEGLPQKWDKGYPGYEGYSAGTFNKSEPPFQDDHATWVKGWYDKSVPQFVERLQGNVTFLHMDADLYSSTATAFEHLAPRLSANCIIVFDELVNYPDYQNGEMKALWELLQKTGRSIEVIGAEGPNVNLVPSGNPNDPERVSENAVVLLL